MSGKVTIDLNLLSMLIGDVNIEYNACYEQARKLDCLERFKVVMEPLRATLAEVNKVRHKLGNILTLKVAVREDVRRYMAQPKEGYPGAEMVESDAGLFIHLDDYEVLKAELSRAEGELKLVTKTTISMEEDKLSREAREG